MLDAITSVDPGVAGRGPARRAVTGSAAHGREFAVSIRGARTRWALAISCGIGLPTCAGRAFGGGLQYAISWSLFKAGRLPRVGSLLRRPLLKATTFFDQLFLTHPVRVVPIIMAVYLYDHFGGRTLLPTPGFGCNRPDARLIARAFAVFHRERCDGGPMISSGREHACRLSHRVCADYDVYHEAPKRIDTAPIGRAHSHGHRRSRRRNSRTTTSASGRSRLSISFPAGAAADPAHIDELIDARLDERGLHANPPADRATLIRRATFDLTGMPPTPEEIAAFVADDAEGRV